MIRYALVCAQAHPFEAWFSSSADFDAQAERGLVECPLCASREVRKQIMAPAVAGTRNAQPPAPPAELAARQKMFMEALGELRRHVETHFENVGDRFAREARDIHEGVSENRGIYGEATAEEVRALREDGIAVAPLPPAAAPRPKTQIN